MVKIKHNNPLIQKRRNKKVEITLNTPNYIIKEMGKDANMNIKNGSQGIAVFLIVLVLTSLACGVSDIPNLFATETPTPTATFTPTPTFTPSPIPSSTPTPTPLPSGVGSEVLPNGTNLFTDYDNKYQLVLTDEWVILPIDKDYLDTLLTEMSKQNPDLAKAAEAFKGLDANLVRMVALNSNPKYSVKGKVSNINISAISDPVLSTMPLPFITGALEESMKGKGMKVLTTGVNTIDNDYGVDILYIDIEQSLEGLKIQQRIILFQSNNKLIMLTVTTLPEFKDEIFKMVEKIGASIELLK